MIEEEKNDTSRKNQGEKEKLLPEYNDKGEKIEYIEGTNIDKNLKLFEGDSAIEGKGCCNRFFFSWSRCFLRQAQKGQLHINMLGTLRVKERVQTDLAKVQVRYQKYIEDGEKNALLYAVWGTFFCDIMIQFVLGTSVAILSFASPFLINGLTEFISNGDGNPDLTWENIKSGVLFAGLMVGTQLLSYMISEHCSYYNVITGRRSSNVIIAFIYQKYSKISPATCKGFSSGQIVNFVQVDAQRFFWISYQISNTVQIPLVFSVTIAMAFYYFGWAFFTGAFIFALSFAVNTLIMKYVRKAQIEIMKRKDQRMKVTTEAINNMKMIKLYSWQDNFLQRIYRRRARDIVALRKGGFGITMLISFIYIFPNMLPVATFATYIGLGNYLSPAKCVSSLVLFGLMRGPLLQAPMFFNDLIQLFVSVRRIQSFLETDEVQKTIKERMPDDGMGQGVLKVKGNFSWGFTAQAPSGKNDKGKAPGKKDEKTPTKKDGKTPAKKDDKTPNGGDKEEEKKEQKSLGKYLTLRDIDLEFFRGEFVCVIGDVGCGKSSLLNSIIGDLLYVSDEQIQGFGGAEKLASDQEFEDFKNLVIGTEVEGEKPIWQKGSLSFVEQVPWIQNKTIRENIIFNLPYDEKKYNETIRTCQLTRDLEILPAGDLTEIGEKGINLSGGQKARVSLARACYSRSDIILMDDPISALDANVRKKIFKHVFQGTLAKKTRILVTHAIDFLHLTDRIVVMKEGRIQAVGTFNELQTNPILQEVLEINRKNLEESKKQVAAADQLGDSKRTTQKLLMEDLTQSQHQMMMSNDKINRSTMHMSHMSGRDSQISIVGGDRDSKLIGDAQPQEQKMLYQEAPQDKDRQLQKIDDHESDEDDDDYEPDPSEAEDKQDDMKDTAREEANTKDRGKIIKDEQDEIVQIKLASFQRYFKYAGGWCILIPYLILLITFIVVNLATTFFTQNWSYVPEDEQAQDDTFFFYVTVIAGLVLFSAILTFGRVTLQIQGGLRVGRIAHDILIAFVFRAPINLFYDITPIGKILNRFSKDMAVIDESIYYNFGGFIVCIWQSMSAFIISAIAVPYIIAVFLVFAALVYCLFQYSMKAYRDCYRIETVTMSPILSYFQETFNGNSIIRAYGREKEFIERSYTLINKTTTANQVTCGVFGWYSLRLDILTIIVLAAGCSSAILLRGKVEAVLLSMMLQYLLTLQTYLKSTMSSFGEIMRKMVAVQRLWDLDKVPQELSGQPKAQEWAESKVMSGSVGMEFQREKGKLVWPSEGRVEFKGVYLRYRPNTELVLKNLNFTVEAGQKIGVVGRTGAGKSTISQGLSRIVEICGGNMLIDGIDINQIDIAQVRSKITVIAQDPTLFTGSIRFNLDPFREHTNAAIEQLCIKAGLGELLNREPETTTQVLSAQDVKEQTEVSSFKQTVDLNTEQKAHHDKKKQGRGLYFRVAEGGSNLSAGERQLLCICRAILRKNKIVVLDEATSNIDLITEEKIQSLIESQFTESTVITIAHRLNTIIKSDKVLVLSMGEVAEFDSPANLMQNPDSEFAKLLHELKQKKKDEQFD